MKNQPFRRALSLLLVLTLLLGFAAPVQAVDTDRQMEPLSFEKIEDGEAPSNFVHEMEEHTEEPQYADTDTVRVSIVLEQPSTLERGYSTMGIANNTDAMAYRNSLKEAQAHVTADIESAISNELDVAWNLTLAANIISANVAYGEIETIKAVDGVQDVVLEAKYEPCVVEKEEVSTPNTATSSHMIGTPAAYAAGYTGTGSRVAIIDTGLDMDHQSFSAAGYEYSMALQAAKADMTLDNWMEHIGALTVQEIEKVLPLMNVKERVPNVTGADLYKNTKVPFGYNYIDNQSAYVDHDRDQQGGHGSHVAGIAAANRYIHNADGTFSEAVHSVGAVGVAPDAQLVIMKVFGINGGAYDADYLAAIEDAIILGCDSVNLSLGSAYPGFRRSATYEALFASFADSDIVMTISAGNSGHWAAAAQHAAPGYLYADDVSMHTGGSPGSYSQSLTVASADNDGAVGYYFTVGDRNVVYTETSYQNEPLRTLAGEQEYVFIDGFGLEEDWAAIGEALKGKIAICSRGSSSFFEKAEAAVNHGAIATIIYNNQAGVIQVDLSSYTKTNPCVTITKSDGAWVKEHAIPVTDENGKVLYYTGTMALSSEFGTSLYHSEYYSVSSFSSWGTAGALELKPDIIAPGGSIYSVDGTIEGGQAYVTMSGTSMAAPQAAGMAAVVGQWLEEEGLATKLNLSPRTLIQSLLMSTAVPMEQEVGRYYPVIRQGAGLSNVGAAVLANSYVLMNADATSGFDDGKVKVELGDDPDRTGEYEFSFTLNSMNDLEQKYQLSAELFTQGLISDGTYHYLDTATTALQANVTWLVDGVELVPADDLTGCEFNGDGLINSDDVQALLDYATGARTEIANLAHADLDSDGDTDSHDAYFLLKQLNTGLVTLAPGGKAEIRVKVALTQEQKALLDEGYANGAYVEGYFFAEQLPTEEGVLGTVHSIPMLAFYGNWSDPSMFDRGTYIGRLYGDQTPTYVASLTDNSLGIKYPGDTDVYYYAGNPYMVEDSYPAGREAISMETTVYSQQVSLIRNAAAVTTMVTNQDGEYLYIADPVTLVNGAFYHANSGRWYNTNNTFTLNKRVSSLGAKEGDTITISFVAIPEYYEVDGNLTARQIQDLMDQDVLGDGVYMSTTMKVDSQAPEAFGIYKDLKTGNLLVETRDNNYVASIRVQSKGGRAYGGALPEQTEAGQTTSTVVDLTQAQGKIGEQCLVVVADYAGNETAYTVEYDGEMGSTVGGIYGYTKSSQRGSGQRWMELDVNNLWFVDSDKYSGTELMDYMSIDVTAAEYVGGYVYMAAADGHLYVSRHSDWDGITEVCDFRDVTSAILDLAFNYADGKLYALDEHNTFYTVDLYTGEMTKVVEITLVNPYLDYKGWTMGSYMNISMMTIDDEGKFYFANAGIPQSSFLYSFTLDQVEDGKIYDLLPINNAWDGVIGYHCAGGSMAWDHDQDILYMSTNSSWRATAVNFAYLITVDTETGIGKRASTNSGGYAPDYASYLSCLLEGLYIVPASSIQLETRTNPSGLVLDRTEAQGTVGAIFTLNPCLTPWNLTDQSIIWTTSDSSVAVVEDGTVSLVGPGTATITATTHAEPSLSASCEVFCDKLGDVRLSGLLRDADGGANWVEFGAGDPDDWTSIQKADALSSGGAFMNGLLYVTSGNYMYAIDPDRFTVTNLGIISDQWAWTDAAPALAVGEIGNRLLAVCQNGTTLELISPEKGTLTYFYPNADAPIAGVAYAWTDTYEDGSYDHRYYLLSELGGLYFFTIHVDGMDYDRSMEFIGSVDLDLSLASTMGTEQAASLHYDEESGYLLLAAHGDDWLNRMYAIHPQSLTVAELGDFGDNVWPVVCLYQYQRPQELTVKMRPATAEIFEEDSLQLTASVVPSRYQDQVTWSTSDASLATVDANGLVTAHRSGTVTITATSVDADAQGKHASAACTITVKELASIQMKVNAQVMTDDGAKWVTVDVGTRNFTVNGDAQTAFTGGGAHGGVIYGSNIGDTSAVSYYSVDPTNGYAEREDFTRNRDFAIADLTGVPAKEITLKDKDGNEVQRTAFDFGVYVTDYARLEYFLNYENQVTYGWNLYPYYMTIGAIAHIGETTYTLYDWNGNPIETPCELLYGLGSDGTILEALFYTSYTSNENYPNNVAYSCIRNSIGRVKNFRVDDMKEMTMIYVEEGENKGFLVGYNGEQGAELYYIDMASEEPTSRFIGRIPGATSITAMYTDAELNGTAEKREIPAFVLGSEYGFSSEIGCTLSLEEMNAGEAIISDETTIQEAKAAMSAGSLNTVTVALAAVAKPENHCDNGKTTVQLTADEASTNGVVTVEYDASKLTLESLETAAAFRSVVEEAGKVTFGYVNGTAIEDIATLTFTVKEESAITVTTVQENAAQPDASKQVTLTMPEHDYQVTDSKEPTCTESGYTTYTCVHCGHQKTEEIPAYCPAKEFRDLDPAKWYHAGVCYVLRNGLMKGMAEGIFAPENALTRAQFVTILYRLEGEPNIEGLENPFGDVKADLWYTNAVVWAASKGIVIGKTDTIFDPDAAITREQTAAILYRYSEAKPLEEDLLKTYTDASSVSVYAIDAMNWAVASGLINGMTKTTLAPKGTATRAQIATILMRYGQSGN